MTDTETPTDSSDDKSRAHALYQEAYQLRDGGDLDGAATKIREAAMLRPRVSLYWVALSRFLHELGRLEDALKAASRATDLNPENCKALVFKGLALLDLGRFRESADSLERASGYREDHNILTLLASAQIQFSPELAFASAEKALALEPDWEEARRIRDRARRLLSK